MFFVDRQTVGFSKGTKYLVTLGDCILQDDINIISRESKESNQRMEEEWNIREITKSYQ